jgi:ubiquinone/menaquinone biosynthesis C-methylase UbiE
MSIRSSLFKIYWALEKGLVPDLKYAHYLYEQVLQSHVTGDTEWLDVGCGHQILPQWRAAQEKQLVETCKSVVGIDAYAPSLSRHRTIKARVAGNIGRLPFRGDRFSLVTANMAVEHLDNPGTQFAEIARVLKPGGIFIMHTPNRRAYTTIAARLIPDVIKKKLVYLLQQREPEDVFATFYRANTSEEIATLAGGAGLRVRKIKLIVSSAELVMVPPLVVFELIWIRLLMTRLLKPFRTNIIAVLQKSDLTAAVRR